MLKAHNRRWILIYNPWSKDREIVIFGTNDKEKVIGISNIKITHSVFIENIMFVDSLKYYLT